MFLLVSLGSHSSFFPSRLVHLDKLRLQTRRREAEQDLARGGKDPFIVVKNPSASKGGVAETSIKVQCSWPTGYGQKLSNSQVCCLAQLCLAAA